MSEIKVKKQVTTISEVTTHYECDVCSLKVEKDRERYPDNFKSVSTRHGDWGNDSCDSWTYYDVCSPECYFKLMKDCCKHNTSRTYEFDEIEIDFAKSIIKYLESLQK